MVSQNKQMLKVLLLILSFIDLIFGILSFVFEPVEWQIYSLVASIMTFVCLIVLIVLHKDETRGNISTMIFGVADIVTGALSIVLVVYALKAIVVTLSVLKSLKVGKIVIQGEKALKLSKATMPVAKKIAGRAFPVLLSFIYKKIKQIFNRRGKNMSQEDVVKEVKKNGICAFIKNNWQTILGFIALAYIVVEAIFGFIYNALDGAGINGMWSQLIITPLYGLAVNAIVKSGIELGKSKQVRELAKSLGVESVYDRLTAMYDEKLASEEEQLKEEEKRQKFLAKLAEVEQEEERQKAEQEKQKEEDIKKAQIEQEERELEKEAQLLMLQYKQAIANGSFVGTIQEYYDNLTKALSK